MKSRSLFRAPRSWLVMLSFVWPAASGGGCAGEEEQPGSYSYTPSAVRCGNGRAEGAEACDGADLRSASCASLGQGQGALACRADCTAYDNSGCDAPCTPNCQGRQCGPDPVCGTSCGSCTSGSCDLDGRCVVDDPDAPRVLSFDTNVNSMTAGQSVRFTALVTDPDGIDDLIGGSLIDPVTSNSYGAFATSAAEGSYELILSWAEINQLRPIDFTSSDNRVFVARFLDQAGHSTSVQKIVTMTCNGTPSCNGTCNLSRCGTSCFDLRQDEAHCGSCTNICMDGGTCVTGACECSAWGEIECPGSGCVSLQADPSHCGTCGKSCPSGYCSDGRCNCGGTAACPGSEICAEYKASSTIYHRCFGVGDGYLSGSRTATSGEVQLTVDGTPLAVCSWFHSSDLAQVLCRELHGPAATVVSVNSDWAINAGLAVYAACVGTESRLSDCPVSFQSYCPFDEGYFVECGVPACTPQCDGKDCGDDGCDATCGTCEDGDVCGDDGLCQTATIPPTWTCNASYYNAADGCDCECGAYDLDCSLTDQTLYGCDGVTNAACNTAGHCVSQ